MMLLWPDTGSKRKEVLDAPEMERFEPGEFRGFHVVDDEADRSLNEVLDEDCFDDISKRATVPFKELFGCVKAVADKVVMGVEVMEKESVSPVSHDGQKESKMRVRDP